MPVFVLMTRLAPESMQDVAERRARGRQWIETIRAACPEAKWLAHYAILGPYDFMDIYEAPDVETAQKVSLVSRARGAVTAESWQALPYERYLELLQQVKS